MAYIDKNKALEILNRNSITKKITLADGISIYDSISNLPTADVQEVKRGYDTKKCRIFECSVCGYGVNDIFQSNESDYPVGNFNYCPNCGAKMDLKEPTYCEDKKNHLCHCEECHERECER